MIILLTILILISAPLAAQNEFPDISQPLKTGKLSDKEVTYYEEVYFDHIWLQHYPRDVRFIDSLVAIGATLQPSILKKTTDGGRTWDSLLALETRDWDDEQRADLIADLAVPTPNRIIATAGKARVFTSHDGGKTFSTIDFNNYKLTIPQPIINHVAMLDSNNGVVGEILDGMLWQTTDGGLSWYSLNVDKHSIFPVDIGVQSVLYVEKNVILVIGSGGGKRYLARTEDNGLTWTTREFLSGDFYKVSPDTLFYRVRIKVVAGGYPEYDIVLRSTDKGKSWHYVLNSRETQYSYANAGGLVNLTFAPNNSNLGIMMGDRGIIFTTDGGLTWAVDTTDYRKPPLNYSGDGALFRPLYFYEDGSFLSFYLSVEHRFLFARIYLNPVIYPATSVQEMVSQEHLPVYPNPATETVNVSFPLLGDVSLFSSDGRQHTLRVQPGVSVINVSSLPAGTYFGNIQTNDGTIKNIKFSIFR